MTSSHIVLLDKAVIAAASWVPVGGEKPFFSQGVPCGLLLAVRISNFSVLAHTNLGLISE